MIGNYTANFITHIDYAFALYCLTLTVISLAALIAVIKSIVFIITSDR